MDNDNDPKEEQQQRQRRGAIDSAIRTTRNIQKAAQGIRTAVSVAQWVANPYFITFATFIILAIILLYFSGSGGGSFPGLNGGTTSSQPGNGNPGTVPGGFGGLDYSIPFRDSSISADSARDIILKNWPSARMENFDNIVQQAKEHGWNPNFLLSLWIEESGGQSVQTTDPLGCDPSHPTDDINISLGCVFRSFDSYKSFSDFMCKYSESTLSPCTFTTNPNFPITIKSTYKTLVPDGPGALINAPPPVASTTATCPAPGAIVTCGSRDTPINGCGHCNPNTSYASDMNQCTYEGINYAVDLGYAGGVSGTAGRDVILPSIGGESLIWRKIDESTSSSGQGVIIKYKGSTSDGTTYVIQFHHTESGSGTNIATSGDSGAKICSTCNHVHVEFYKQPATGVQNYIDAAKTFCI